ncbi:MAG: hypothetical protein ACP5NW_01380 [Candidatus Woesearchaeota archaeon]
MTKIIGNPDKERQSRVDTEKWKEHKEYYNDPEHFSKVEEHVPVERQTLEQILFEQEKILKTRPKIPLVPLTRIYIHTKTQAEYDTLMQVYEAGGWTRSDLTKPTDLNIWSLPFHKKITCIEARDGYCHTNTASEILSHYKIITTKKFYEAQQITPDTIHRLNAWYERNYPNRKSKGK